MAVFPSGTVTLFFSDIEGSTRLLRRLGAEYEALLREHRRLIRSAFASLRGVEVETRGDSFLAAFQSAHDAVEAGIEIQRAFATHEWPGMVDVRVRIGLHTGEPTLGDEGYVGLDVHRAARIGDAGNGGQILVSAATRVLVGDAVSLRDLGEYRLAGLEPTERLYQVVAPGIRSDFGPVRARPPLRGSGSRPRSARELEQAGWRVHGLLGAAPVGVRRSLERLATTTLAAARAAADADRVLAGTDRERLAARVADHQARSGVAPHVAAAARDLAGQLVALDRLPERRRAVEERVLELEEIDAIELRLSSMLQPSAPLALIEELDDLAGRLASATDLLLSTRSAAPSMPPLPADPLRRTWRRGIYRAGKTYVVAETDENGVKQPRAAASLAQALELRDLLRASRRRRGDPRDHRDPTAPVR